MTVEGDEQAGTGTISLFGFDFMFSGILAGKIIFMSIISVIFFRNLYSSLIIPFEYYCISFILVVAAFIITLVCGCTS